MLREYFANFRKLLLVLSATTLTVLIAVGFYFWQGIYFPGKTNVASQYFTVEKGSNVFQISQNLEQAGLVKDDIFFNLYVLATGGQKKLQAGMYVISPSMNIPQIAEKIISGRVDEVKVTIPEGFNLRQIQERISQAYQGNSEIKFPSAGFFQKEYGFLGAVPADASLEGFLFPDTYSFSYLFKQEDIAKIMLANFDKKMAPELREEIKNQNKTIFEIITMASLLEEEVRTKEDKTMVSGVLWKRLRAGALLQVDAADPYYDTYKYRGLPPGPISNPGLESIAAAVYPKNSDYWYYLSAPDGKTIFSRTLLEHNIAKAKYLK